MKCRNCGREINDTAAFCGHCNAIVKPEQRKIAPQRPPVQPPVMTPPPANNQPDDSTPVYRKWWFWTVIALLLILIVGIVFFGLFAGDDDSKNETKPSETIATVQTDFTKPSTPAQADDEALTEVVSMIHNGSFDNFEGGNGNQTENSVQYTSLMFNETVNISGLCDISVLDVFVTERLYNYNENPSDESAFFDIAGERYIMMVGTIKNTSAEEIMPTYMYRDFIINGVSISDVYFSEIYLSDADETGYYDIEYLAPGEERNFIIACSIPDELYEETVEIQVVFGFNSQFTYEPYLLGKDYCDYIYGVTANEFEYYE